MLCSMLLYLVSPPISEGRHSIPIQTHPPVEDDLTFRGRLYTDFKSQDSGKLAVSMGYIPKSSGRCATIAKCRFLSFHPGELINMARDPCHARIHSL